MIYYENTQNKFGFEWVCNGGSADPLSKQAPSKDNERQQNKIIVN